MRNSTEEYLLRIPRHEKSHHLSPQFPGPIRCRTDSTVTSPIQTSITMTAENEAPRAKSLIIPLKNRKDDVFIEIFPDELPAVSVLQKVLQTEDADPTVWADAATLYDSASARTLLEFACSEFTNIDKATRVRLLASRGLAQLPDDVSEDSFTAAGKLDTFDPMTWVGRGLWNILANHLDQAQFFFSTTLQQNGKDVLPAVLGLGAVLLKRGDYKGAAVQYATALKHADAGASVRVGLAWCYYQMGQSEKAKAAYMRALQLDPECVEALVGLAVLQQGDERSIQLLSMAHLLDSSHPVVQVHLANHYFTKWTPVAGTVTVDQGSTLVTCTQAVPLETGEPVRIGTSFETVVAPLPENAMDDEKVFYITTPYKGESTKSIKIWRKDLDRSYELAKGAYDHVNANLANTDSNRKLLQAEALLHCARVRHTRGELDDAYKMYKKAVDWNPALVPAQMGYAQLLVERGEFKDAVPILQKVCTSHASTDALSLLGTLQVKLGDLNEGLKNMTKALEMDPQNPQLVLQLALLLQQTKTNYTKALDTYRSVLPLLDTVPVDIYNNMGVLAQETKQFAKSMEYYKQALASLDPSGERREARLDQVGIEGARIRRPENDGALCEFCSAEPAITVKLIADDEHTDNKTLKVEAGDVTGLVSAGDFIRVGPSVQTQVLSVETGGEGTTLVVKDAPPPAYMDKENTTALSDNETHELFIKRENGMIDLPEAITVIFNIARLHEATGKPMAAVEIHRAIIKRHPTYVNSYLRLGCIAVDSGALKECSDWLKIAAEVSPGNPEVLALIGNLHLSLRDWQPAQRVFEGMMGKKIQAVEAYAGLSMGTIYFDTIHEINVDRYKKHLGYAGDFYRRILEKDALNVYAANGLGTVLAEMGDIFKAKEIFNRVREVSEDGIADALFNLGHIYLAQKKHPEALQMYNSFLRRVEDISTPTTAKNRTDDYVDVLLFIAFAYFDWARHTELPNDSTAAPADARYKKAMECINTALQKNSPKKEMILNYNMCMIKLQAANCVLQKLTRNIPRTVEEVEEALNGLQESMPIVETILEEKRKEGTKVMIKTSTLEEFLTNCQANIVSAKSHLEDEKKRAAEEKQEREIRRLAAEAAQKEEDIRKAIKMAEDTKKEEERERKAEMKMRKMEELRHGWDQQQAAQQALKDKRARKLPDGGGFIVEDDGKDLFADSDDDEPPADAKPAAEEPSHASLFGDSSDEEEKPKDSESSKPAEEPNSALFGDSSDDEDAAAPAKKEGDDEEETEFGSAGPTSASNKDLFGDSDDDDDDVNDDGKRPANEDSTPAPKKRRLAEDDE